MLGAVDKKVVTVVHNGNHQPFYSENAMAQQINARNLIPENAEARPILPDWDKHERARAADVRNTAQPYVQQLANLSGSKPDLFTPLSFPSKGAGRKPIVNPKGEAWERPRLATEPKLGTHVHLLPGPSQALFKALEGAPSKEEAVMMAQLAAEERNKIAVGEAISQTRAEMHQQAFDDIKKRAEAEARGEEPPPTVGGAIFEAPHQHRQAALSHISVITIYP